MIKTLCIQTFLPVGLVHARRSSRLVLREKGLSGTNRSKGCRPLDGIGAIASKISLGLIYAFGGSPFFWVRSNNGAPMCILGIVLV